MGATASSPTRGAATTQAPTGHAARVLLPLLGIYALGTVSLQGFNLVYLRVAADIGAGEASGLITAIPGIVLGVACFLYGTLGDFPPRFPLLLLPGRHHHCSSPPNPRLPSRRVRLHDPRHRHR